MDARRDAGHDVDRLTVPPWVPAFAGTNGENEAPYITRLVAGSIRCM
jgi:hypothetical protein